MSDTSSSTGVQAKISRWFDEPSNTLIAKPESGEVAVDAKRHLVRVVAAGIGPAGEEAPLLVGVFPVQADRCHGGAVDIPEMCTVWPVFGDELRVHRDG